MTIVPLLLLCVSPIQIDGSFDDWSVGQTQAQDAHYLYKRVLLNPESCLQQLPAQLHVDLGAYDIVFSPTNKGYGVTCSKDGETISPYDIGIVFAPTTASTEFEIRINKPRVTLPNYAFDLDPTTNVRIVSWNVQFGNLLDDVDRGGRILRSLQPDVLLLQELDGDDSSEDVQSYLANALGGEWAVYMSDVSGEKRHQQLRSAIATRLPSAPIPTTIYLPRKTAIANIAIGGKTITFISLHLRCCGGPTSEAEQQRTKEAAIIRRAVDKLDSDGVVIAGDWNLVGTNTPLKTVASRDMDIVDAYQPDGVLTATWSDTTSAFTPGRLDWMLVTKSLVSIDRGFVLDTADLDTESLNANDLLSDDTAELSDHLPLVADVRIKSQ